MSGSSSRQRTSGKCPRCRATFGHPWRVCSNCDATLTPARPASRGVASGASSPAEPDAVRLCGRVLDSTYELLECAGAGGMGSVFRARRLPAGDIVAVKVLSRESCKDAVLVRRFRREVWVATQSHDPRVIEIYDSGKTADGVIYLVMPFVDAPTLRKVLDVEKLIHWERAARLMSEVCGGVAATHRLGIAHRDLKPENLIVLPPDGVRGHESVKVLDFGIAKPLNPTMEQMLTQPGMILGTPLYMSPEQCRGEALDARTDVYSLGVVLYEMLTGLPPFVAHSIAEIIAKHLMDAPPPMPEHLCIPKALEAVVMQALSKDTAGRQADARALALALEESIKPPAPRPRRRRGKIS